MGGKIGNQNARRPDNCRICGVLLNTTNWYPSLSPPNGRQHICIDCHKAKFREGYSRNRTAEHVRQREKSRRLKQVCLDAYGTGCACCGEKSFEFLCIDHIAGGGNRHRKEVGYGSGFYRWLKSNNFPIGFRVLCMNCNFSYGHYGICPHAHSLG